MLHGQAYERGQSATKTVQPARKMLQVGLPRHTTAEANLIRRLNKPNFFRLQKKQIYARS